MLNVHQILPTFNPAQIMTSSTNSSRSALYFDRQ